MKKVLLIAAVLFFAMPSMQAQDKDEAAKVVLVKEDNSDNYYYEGVVPVEGVTKEEMFKRAKQWVLSTFKTEDNSSGFDEKGMMIFDSPTILVRPTSKDNDDYVNFKFKILFKEGKYKFRIDNVIVKSNCKYMTPRPAVSYNGDRMFKGFGVSYNKRLIEGINIAFVNLISDLENSIKNTRTKNEDW